MHLPAFPRAARTRGDRRGQSMVEFGLVLPILVLLVAGVIDVSRLVAMNSAAVSASREAARYGAAVGTDDGGTERYVDCAGIRAAARRASSVLFTLADSQIRVSYDNGSGAARSSACAPHGTGPVAGEIQNLDRVIVEVTASFEAITPLVGDLVGPITISSLDRRTIVTETP